MKMKIAIGLVVGLLFGEDAMAQRRGGGGRGGSNIVTGSRDNGAKPSSLSSVPSAKSLEQIVEVDLTSRLSTWPMIPEGSGKLGPTVLENEIESPERSLTGVKTPGAAVLPRNRVDVSVQYSLDAPNFSPPSSFNPKIITTYPDLASFKIAYNRNPTSREAAQIREYTRRFSEIGAISVTSSSNATDIFRSAIESAASSGHGDIVVVGHSLGTGAGRVLVLPDGARILLKDVHAMGISCNVNIRILTCHGSDFYLAERIGIDEAYEMVRHAVAESTAVRTDFEMTAEQKRTELDRLIIYRRELLGGRRFIHQGTTAIDPSSKTIFVWESKISPPAYLLYGCILATVSFGYLLFTMGKVRMSASKMSDLTSFVQAASQRRIYMRYQRRFSVVSLALFFMSVVVLGSSRWVNFLQGSEDLLHWQAWSCVPSLFLSILVTIIWCTSPETSIVGKVSHSLGGSIAGSTFFVPCAFYYRFKKYRISSGDTGCHMLIIASSISALVYIVAFLVNDYSRNSFGEIFPKYTYVFCIALLLGTSSFLGRIPKLFYMGFVRGLQDGWRASFSYRRISEAWACGEYYWYTRQSN